MSALTGKRILLVEDEFMIAQMAGDMLKDLGATVVGPASTIAKALVLAEREALDAAVLDVNMRGERIDPVAEALRSRGVPLVFTTGYGYGGGAGAQAGEAPVLDKPYTAARLAKALCQVLDGAR